MELRLRELRENRGLSVAQMIARLGVDDSRYRKWESSTSQIPLKYACDCADILKCTLDELVSRTAPNTREVLTPDEMTIIEVYREADMRGRRTIERAVDGVKEDMEDEALEKKEAV